MRRGPILLLAAFLAVSCGPGKAMSKAVPGDVPFGWAVCTSLDSGDDYELTGGGQGSTVVLTSTGGDMRKEIIKAVRDHDIIIFDGSQGDFTVSRVIEFKELRNKTLMGVSGARIRTSFVVDDAIRKLLEDAGVRKLSSNGGGGSLSNGEFVREECEQHTRQAIINYTGDSKESYRRSGLFSLEGCENFIIRNLDFVGPGPIDVSGTDLLNLSGTRHVWVDHCSFTDGMDGNFDINSRSDFITVSWCSFQYSDNAFDHRLSSLIGSNENPSQGEDCLNVTFAYCYWGSDCQGRMPLVRWGRVHILNCWYDCPQLRPLAINGRKGSEVLVEGCMFEDGLRPFSFSDDALAWQLRDNVFKGGIPSVTDHGKVVLPYSYTAVSAETLPSMLTGAVGPVLKL